MRDTFYNRLSAAHRALAIGIAISLSLVLAACGGSDYGAPVEPTPVPTPSPTPTPTPAPGSYTIGGTVTGLEAGQAVTLQNNGADTLAVKANGAFTFATAQSSNTAYEVAVSTEPTQRTTCTVTNGTGTVGASNVTNVAVSCATQHFAYVVNSGVSAVSLCNVDAGSGALSNCAPTGSGFNAPGDIALSIDGTHAYVSNAKNAAGSLLGLVSVCDVSASTGALSNCVPTGSGFRGPRGVTLTADGKRAYVANVFRGSGPNSVSLCDVDAVSGAFSNCTGTGDAPFMDDPTNVFLTAEGTWAYVNLAGWYTSAFCAVDPSTGALSSCTANSSPSAKVFNNMVLTADGAHAYMTLGQSVDLCSVDTVSGVISNCSAAGTFANGATRVALSADGTKAYVTSGSSGSNSTVSLCDVGASDGMLTNCASTGTDNGYTFNNPIGIAIH